MKIFPIFIPFAGCQYRCMYCQQNLITKTIKSDFPLIRKQLAAFCARYADQEKEIAFFGGSFTLLKTEQQESLISEIAPFLPLFKGIRISTRPDGIDDEILGFAAKQKITTIELGIQSFSDPVLKATERPYNRERALSSCRMIQKVGFRLAVQLMPGLPGENAESIQTTIETTISLKPDFVRLYPTLVLRDTELAKRYKSGLYEPLTLEEAVDICAEMTIRFRNNGIKVIKTGLHSDLSSNPDQTAISDDQMKDIEHFPAGSLPDTVLAGPYHPAFGELVSREILYRNILAGYQIDKTLVISSRAISLFKRDGSYLLHKIKKYLSVDHLPVILDDKLDKDTVYSLDREPDIVW